MEISIVLDLGFGDSGKGLVTDYLTKNSLESGKNPIVIRFSGGHQAGHTVVLEGNRHVFSNFGAGTLRGAPSYFSRHTAVFPPAILGEREALLQARHTKMYAMMPANKLETGDNSRKMPPEPILFLDPLAVVTTPFDIAYNRITESKNQHGSCGLGITATFQRSEILPLFVQDLKYDWILQQKVSAIQEFYIQKLETHPEILQEWKEEIEGIDTNHFLDDCKICVEFVRLSQFPEIIQNYDSLIFEASQGILLDRLHGIYPHVTYANTTSKNAWDLLNPILKSTKFGESFRNSTSIENTKLKQHSQSSQRSHSFHSSHYFDSTQNSDCSHLISVYYTTRAYQTRHGAGPMSEIPVPSGLSVDDPTNSENPFQGALRSAGLDFTLLDYAIQVDSQYHPPAIPKFQNLVVTCTDHVPGWSPAHLREITTKIGRNFHSIYQSSGPTAEDIQLSDIKLFDKSIQ